MRQYQTLVEALEGLKNRGYVHDFNLQSSCVECPDLDLRLHPQDFEIREVYRFEGMSNPDDNSVLYAIESNTGVKGVLVDAYGVYSEALSPEMIARLK
ncbi:MAG: phosphoribosylpyrophosphate synthetase [Lewinellaceae bacterium]|nr:phosphoribosylpyrophosphate synthetase [Lewinellaceae bacterium]